jgi:hypothetical protein
MLHVLCCVLHAGGIDLFMNVCKYTKNCDLSPCKHGLKIN